MGRLIVLSGPSCIGKGPLHGALKRFYPELADRMETLVLYNSRAPRPGEVDGRDYHFRSRAVVEAFRERDEFLVMDVRGDLQALNLADLEKRLSRTEKTAKTGMPSTTRSAMRAVRCKRASPSWRAARRRPPNGGGRGRRCNRHPSRPARQTGARVPRGAGISFRRCPENGFAGGCVPWARPCAGGGHRRRSDASCPCGS